MHRPDHLAPAAGPHGGDVVAVARALGCDPDDLVDLSASVNPEAPPLAPVLGALEPSLRRYPDDTAATRTLAEAIGVDPGRLVLTNGGAEAIALVAAERPRGSVEQPEFSLYERHLTELDPTGPRWRSNPGNPLGRLAPPDASAAVWDEAFWPLATGTWSRGDEDAWRLGSLTKLWACPGVRLGYVIAPSGDDAAAIRRRQPRWAVGALALAVAEHLVGRTDLGRWSELVRRRRADLVRLLTGHGFVVTDTDANWVLVEQPGLRADLLTQGVLVRDLSSFGLPGWHRVAVPDDAGFDRLAASLARVAP